MQKRRSPREAGFCVGRVSDDDLLSRGIPRTIIGAASFHGPVRNGKAWGQRAMVVREAGGRSRLDTASPSGIVLGVFNWLEEVSSRSF